MTSGPGMIASILPTATASHEVFADVLGDAVHPAEAALVCGAVESRRREFVTARHCARRALADLGYPSAPIPSGPRREPVWPAGAVGSITHCQGYRAAAVAHRTDVASIGIDAEPHQPLPRGVEESVASELERGRLRELGAEHRDVHWGRLLFSAKESVYKAWYPLTERWLGFLDADVTLDPEGSFSARILVDPARRGRGRPLHTLAGRFTLDAGLVKTAVVVLG